MDNVKKGNGCGPSEPAPQQTNEEYCEGTIRIPCCCPKLMTRTFIVPIGPQTEPQVAGFMSTTVNNYEANGYLILGHSLVDTGAGWLLGLTVGWYA